MKCSQMRFLLVAVSVAVASSLGVSPSSDDDPQLPAVASMVSTETDTLKDITSQADTLRARVVQIQTENEASLAKQRAIFEHQLKKQERNNRAINATNAQINEEINSLKSGNAGLKKEAAELRKTNERIVSEIKTLEAKVSVSKDFLASSLEVEAEVKPAVESARMVERRAQETMVNQRETDGDESDERDDFDEGEDDRRAPSFFTLTKSARRSRDPDASPADLINVLSKRVLNFAAQAKDSQTKLKSAFDAAFAEGERRRLAFVAEQKRLNSTRSSLLAEQTELRAVDDKLTSTKLKYQQRLRGFGLFLQRLAHVALAPDNTADQMLQDIPDTISVTAKF